MFIIINFNTKGIKYLLVCSSAGGALHSNRVNFALTARPYHRWVPPTVMELDVIQVLCWDQMDPLPMAFIARSYRVLHFDRLVGVRLTLKGVILVVRSEPTWCWPRGLREPWQPESYWQLQEGSLSRPYLENVIDDVH